jgi:hypothetical protein
MAGELPMFANKFIWKVLFLPNIQLGVNKIERNRDHSAEKL